MGDVEHGRAIAEPAQVNPVRLLVTGDDEVAAMEIAVDAGRDIVDALEQLSLTTDNVGDFRIGEYARMMRLFNWMGIDGASLMFGLDHVGSACSKIMCL